MPNFGVHFKSSEFDSPDKEGTGEYMQQAFLDKLIEARKLAGIPFIVNSGYRTQNHNTKVGGEPNSSHMRGWACDLGFKNGSQAYTIFNALQRAGFNRLGMYRSWIHCDCDPTLSPNVYWSK
jgi:zinc D-Ala-D-Ala carboxypeptidase